MEVEVVKNKGKQLDVKGPRWSRKVCTHPILQELQNYNLLLKNNQQENVGGLKQTLCAPGPRDSTEAE